MATARDPDRAPRLVAGRGGDPGRLLAGLTRPLGLYAFFGEDTAEWGKIMAASALTALPTLVLFLPLQTRLAAGLAQGAVKQ
jgi:ABC-type maltose transport system permease subunit